jgi:hypothetical protein
MKLLTLTAALTLGITTAHADDPSQVQTAINHCLSIVHHIPTDSVYMQSIMQNITHITTEKIEPCITTPFFEV